MGALCPCGSDKLFDQCHGGSISVPANMPKLVESPTSKGLRLDFGCGNTPKDGFEGVDLYGDKAVHHVDLFKFPFPWADDSVDEIWCSHFAEHIPAREIEQRDLIDVPGAEKFLGLDMFFAFFEECYRVLKKDCWMHVIVPCLRNNRAFQDPTHRRFICEETFAYLWADWRKINIPQYPVKCNFATDVQTTIPNEIGLRTPEVQSEMIRTRWNVGFDLVAKMKCLK